MSWTLSLKSNFWILFLLESGTKSKSYERCGCKGQRLKAKNWANSDISLSHVSGMCSTGMEKLVLCLLMSNVKHPLFSFIQMMDGWKNWWRCKKEVQKRYKSQTLTPHILTSVFLLHREMILSGISTIQEEESPSFCTTFKRVLEWEKI